MKQNILILGFSLFVVGMVMNLANRSEAITVNPGNAVTGDSAATADTVFYRDDNGDGAVHALTVNSLLKTGGTAISSNTKSVAITGTFTQTAFNACSSTITLNFPTAGSIALVSFSGSMSNSTLDKKTSLGIELDGAYVNNETAALGMVTQKQEVAAKPTPASFTAILTGISAGQHNICLAAWVDANTGTFDSTDSAATLSAVMLP